jgi:outer membrane protein OmpA-like peptidoglycan-associated protein
MVQATSGMTVAFLLSIFAAAAPARSAQAEASPVLVFFDWGKPDIGGDAVAALDALAADYRAAPGRRLQVSGYSDRSGSAAGNRRSATRRAEAVAAYLAARGVPRGAMAIASFGEERPLIPTADGVREPQNRRVEIGIVSDTAP